MRNKVLFLAIFILFGVNTQAQVLIGNAATQFEPKAEYLIDSTNKLSLNQVSKGPFELNKSVLFNFKNENTIWIKIDLKAKNIQQNQFILGFTQAFIDSLIVYNVSSTDTIKLATSDIINRKRIGFYNVLANPMVPFTVSKTGPNQIFICLRNKIDIVSVNILICSPESALNQIVSYERFISMFFGFLMAICILSMIYFLLSKTLMYLYYSFYISFICLYLESSLGNLYLFFPNIHEFFTGQNSDVMYGLLAVIFNLHFLEKLFESNIQKSYFHLFKKFVISISILFFIYNIGTNALPSSLLIPLLLVVSQISMLFFAYSPQNTLFKVYVIGLTPLFIICIVRILSLLHIIEQPQGIGVFVLTAVSFELLILMILQSKVFFDEIKEKNLLKTQIVKNQIETQETERKTIAQDLHDDLGATLSALKGSILKADFSQESHNLLNKAITDLRAISRRLLPADFEMFGFIRSVEKYIADINQQQKIKVTFIVFGEKIKLNTEKELNIYRIITELVNNSVKYSDGQNATVQLVYHQDYLFVSIEDDGQIKNKIENNLGIGLKNVISRLEYLNAKQIEIGGQNGYSFIFEIPYQPNL